MKDLRLTSAFKNDLKRITKRGYDRGLLDAVVALLREAQLLPAARRDHALQGVWKGRRECHVVPEARTQHGPEARFAATCPTGC